MLVPSAKKKIKTHPAPPNKKINPHKFETLLKVKSIYWLEYELDKAEYPLIRKLAKDCCIKQCNKRAQIKITRYNKQSRYYCTNHGEKEYWANKKNILQIEKKWWFKI